MRYLIDGQIVRGKGFRRGFIKMLRNLNIEIRVDLDGSSCWTHAGHTFKLEES